MGLDMYLEAKKYRYQFAKLPENVEVLAAIMGNSNGFHPSRIKCITEDAIYWRKSNHIHKWFVDNIQNGNDDCEIYDVLREELQQLLLLVEKVLAAKNKRNRKKVAQELLPPAEGFYFGNTEIEKWYWDDLEFTAKELSKVLEEYDDTWDFYYVSSW
jgi:hypothetical protein